MFIAPNVNDVLMLITLIKCALVPTYLSYTIIEIKMYSNNPVTIIKYINRTLKTNVVLSTAVVKT